MVVLIILFYGNTSDLKCLIGLEKELSFKIKKIRNIFYKRQTHGIFVQQTHIDNYVNYIRTFIN